MTRSSNGVEHWDGLDNDPVHDPFEEELNFASRKWTLHEVFGREAEKESEDSEE